MPATIRKIVLLSLAGGVLVDVVLPGNALGVNAPLVMAALLGAAFLVAGPGGLRRMDPADAWLAPVALALSAMAVVRADDWLVAWDLAFAAALAAGMIGCLAGGRITRGLVPQVLELGVGAGLAALAGAGTLLLVPRRGPVAGGVETGRPSRLWRACARMRRAAPVARGLLIALPVAAVFAALFASADAVFARLASDAMAWKPDVDFEDIAIRTFVVGIVAWGAAGLLGLAGGLLPAFGPPSAAPGVREPGRPEGSDPVPAPTPVPVPTAIPATPALAGPGHVVTAGHQPPAPPSSSHWRPPRDRPAAGTWPRAGSRAAERDLRLGSTEAATILVIVDVLFAVFVALQLAYLFGGRDTMAMTGLTYAEYARRGFFELVLVAILAGGLVVTMDIAVASRSRVHLGSSLVLLALTALVLASALARLRLYQDAYGWTELRFVVLVSIAWLAVALAAAAALLLARRTRWTLHALGIMVLVALAGMNVVGPQAFVAERNLERSINPSLVPPGGRTGLDSAYLDELGDEAIAPVVDAWERLGPADRSRLRPSLVRRAEQFRTDPSLSGWPAWNLTRERAAAALVAWESQSGR